MVTAVTAWWLLDGIVTVFTATPAVWWLDGGGTVTVLTTGLTALRLEAVLADGAAGAVAAAWLASGGTGAATPGFGPEPRLSSKCRSRLR